MNPKLKQYLPYAIIAILVLLLILNKCANDNQDQHNVSQAVSQNHIENLQAALSVLESKEIGYKAANDSLVLINSALSRQLTTNRAKLAQIALNYEKERQRIKALPNDSAASLFLDRSDCSECEVLQYDSAYLIPIESIQFYNLMAVDFDQQVAVNGNLIKENKIYQLQVKNLNSIIDNDETRIGNLKDQVNNYQQIISEKDKQLQAEHKKLKKQRFKTVLTGIAGAALAGFAFAL